MDFDVVSPSNQNRLPALGEPQNSGPIRVGANSSLGEVGAPLKPAVGQQQELELGGSQVQLDGNQIDASKQTKDYRSSGSVQYESSSHLRPTAQQNDEQLSLEKAPGSKQQQPSAAGRAEAGYILVAASLALLSLL